MKIKIFGKKGCAKCETTRNKLSHFIEKWNYNDIVSLDFMDMDTIDGVAEGAYYDVLKIPTTVIEKDNETIARWDGEVPNSDELKTHFETALQKV
ncbi:MAG: thioredoxin family protein [Candidatus Omnitrophota bacterium]